MSMSVTNRRLAWSYGIAAVGVLLAGLSPWWLTPLIGDTPPMRLILVLVVTVAGWLGGAGPGLLATAMGLAAIVATNDRPGDWQSLAVRLGRFGSLALLINLLFAIVDIQRRRAEQRERAYLRSEGRYRRLIEAAAEGIWAIDKDGRTTYANPRLGEILGEPPADLVGRHLSEFLVDFVDTPASWADSSGQPLAWHEVRLRRCDGTLRDAVVTMRSIASDDDSSIGRPGQRPEKGAAGGLMLMVTDVTLLKRVERALREKESLLRSFYQSSSTAMGVIELAGDDARIVSANAPTDRLFGQAPGAVEGRTARELGMPPHRLSAWLEHLRRCRATGRPVRFEERGAWPAGPEWVAATLSAMDSPGTGGDLCSFLIEDITERKRNEEDLRVAKELAEAASRAKDRFLAVLSHELRTPLTPVMIAVSSLIESGPDPSILPELEMIRRNIELESRLIDDLLDLSRIARGRLRLDIEAVDMHQALRRAVEICREETFVAGLEVFTDLTAREYHVAADHARIMQIAWNLVRNAAKFTPTGGRLIIRTSNPTNGDVDPGRPPGAGGSRRLIVEFADTGIGIAPEVLPRIFDAFEQGHNDVRGRSRGLGLGLAICRSLAEAMGGRLTASSPGPGLGSTFRLEIATVPAPAPAPAPFPAPGATGTSAGDAPSPPRESSLHMLLVEDNADTLRYLATVLRRRGHDVVTADTIAAARQALARADRPFDLLLSDIELPDGNGLELMRDLRDRSEIPGIAMSGFGAEEDLQLSRAAGFLDHLIKPIDPARLDAAIRRAAEAARTGRSDDDDGSSGSSTAEPSSGPFRVVSMHEP
jgi:PAS domain S-box-containing protein